MVTDNSNLFYNTLRDLGLCQEKLENMAASNSQPLSDDELTHAKALVQCCLDIISFVADEAGIDFEAGEFEGDDGIEDIIDNFQIRAEETRHAKR